MTCGTNGDMVLGALTLRLPSQAANSTSTIQNEVDVHRQPLASMPTRMRLQLPKRVREPEQKRGTQRVAMGMSPLRPHAAKLPTRSLGEDMRAPGCLMLCCNLMKPAPQWLGNPQAPLNTNPTLACVGLSIHSAGKGYCVTGNCPVGDKRCPPQTWV